MQPCVQPVFSIPCAWMPIFDMDCYPYMHSGQIQAMPQAPQPAPIQREEPMIEESPVFQSRPPGTPPEPSSILEGWQLVESPEMPSYESPEMPSYESPMYHFEESAYCPPEDGYVPQALSPSYQMPMPMPNHHHGQQGGGCGCGGGHQPVMMPMPLFYGHPCHCNSPTHAHPFHMMPAPHQSNWYGSY